MDQEIEKILMHVVEFDTMPETPITGLTEEELKYELDLAKAKGKSVVLATFEAERKTGRYAWALTDAIDSGIITEPGKYGIHVVPGEDRYEIFKIDD